MGDLLKFSVPGKAEYVCVIRRAISSLASCAAFDIDSIEDIKVAVSEACMNVVRHGSAEDNCYDVECVVEKDKIIIFVSDCCGGYSVSSYQEPYLDEPKERGLGIFIIKALMDEVDICSVIGEGTKIKMVKYIV